MSEKNKLDLEVQYPDDRLEKTVTPEMVERWVQGALFAPAELRCALSPKKKAAP